MMDAGFPRRAAITLEANAPAGVPARIALAEAYLLGGRWPESRRLVQGLIAEGVQSPLAAPVLAMLDAMERRPEAEERLAEAERDARAHPVALDLVARGYSERLNWSAAERCYRAAIKVHPRCVRAREGLAGAYEAQERWEEAIVEARAATGLDPESFHGWYHLGVASARLGRIPQAITALKTASKVDRGRSSEIPRILADLYDRQGDPGQAELYRWLAAGKERIAG